MRPIPEIVAALAPKAAEMLPLSKQHDTESQATLSAKRRVFKVFLETEGLDQGLLPAELIEGARAAGKPELVVYLESIAKLRQYAQSEARKTRNPSAKPSDVPVSFDWFVSSNFPKDWEAMDFLARCESLFADQGFKGEGAFFTRIFEHRVKFVVGFEDGIRLVLLRTEVGDAVAAPETGSKSAAVVVEPIDLVRRIGAYDGHEPDDWYALIDVPMGRPYMRFSLGEIGNRPFKDLEAKLGAEAFELILKKQGFKRPKGPFETFSGEDGLEVHYYTRDGDKPGSRELILVSFGEFQPGRYKAHIEGFWRVSNANI